MGKRRFTVRHNVKNQYGRDEYFSVYESLDHYTQVIVYSGDDYYWVKIRYHVNNPKYGRSELNMSWDRVEALGAIIKAIKLKFGNKPLKINESKPLPGSVELKL